MRGDAGRLAAVLRDRAALLALEWSTRQAAPQESSRFARERGSIQANVASRQFRIQK
jgi:hypothetical protein